LELDTVLSINACAQCRVWAEQLYKAKCGRLSATTSAKVQTQVRGAGALQDGDDEGAIASAKFGAVEESGSQAVRSVVLVAVVDVNHLKSAFGMSSVECLCTLDLFRPGGNHSNAFTQVKFCCISGPTMAIFTNFVQSLDIGEIGESVSTRFHRVCGLRRSI
jgi:hypothetical protein